MEVHLRICFVLLKTDLRKHMVAYGSILLQEKETWAEIHISLV